MKKINPLIHVGGGQRLKKSIIIGIFNEKTISADTFTGDKYAKGKVDFTRDSKSMVLCEGDFIIESYTNSKTLYHRYEKQRDVFSKNLK